jgi:hypothetical protein
MPRRRNPLDLDSWLPRTGNPSLDALARNGVERAAAHLYGQLPPNAQQFVSTLAGAFAGSSVPVMSVQRNPIMSPAPAGDSGRFLAELLALPAGLFVTLGRRGSGKTAFDLKLAQAYHRQGRPVFVIGMPQRVLSRFGFREITPDRLDALPNGSVLVIDDVALFFSNRDYAKAGLLHKLIIESRHRRIVIIVNAHNSALVDKYLLEATALFLKPSSSVTQDLQRGGVRELIKRADAAFTQIPREVRKGRIYAASDELEFEGMLAYTPPDGWSQAVSEHHGGGR